MQISDCLHSLNIPY